MKTKKYLIYMVCGAALLTGFYAIADDVPSASSNTPASSNSAKENQRFNNAVEAVKNYYVEPVADQKLYDEAIRGMVSGLDPHSTYLDPSDLRDLQDMTTGQFSGLGIEIIPDEGLIKVVSPLDGSPAQKAGIKPGDIILLIDNTPVKGLPLHDAVKKMRGKKGSSVTLTIIRKGVNKPLKIKLVRDDIHIQSVRGKLLEPGYAYVRISSFQTTTASLLEDNIKKMMSESGGKLKGLVLDLRNNPGGLLDSAVAVADDFIDASGNTKKLIVYTKGRLAGSEVEIKATPGDLLKGAPIVVLVNEGSASGSEIVAGALQDDKRAVLVGTNTFGKGSVQTVIPLDDTSAIKLTTALYFTPSGRSIQAQGIKPDVIVNAYKITEADKDILIKESDLQNHLANANKPATNSSTTPAAPELMLNQSPNTPLSLPPIEQLVTSDYQLYEALNILKGLVIAKNSGTYSGS